MAPLFLNSALSSLWSALRSGRFTPEKSRLCGLQSSFGSLTKLHDLRYIALHRVSGIVMTRYVV